MRSTLLLTVLLMGGCATSAPESMTGMHAKNAGPIRIERLGTMTYDRVIEEGHCGKDRVSWCAASGRQKPSSCQCLSIREAEMRATRMLRQRPKP